MQLDKAKSDAAANGIFSDRKWFLSAKYTLHKKGMRHQRLLRVVADKKRKLREKENITRQRIFIEMPKGQRYLIDFPGFVSSDGNFFWSTENQLELFINNDICVY